MKIQSRSRESQKSLEIRCIHPQIRSFWHRSGSFLGRRSLLAGCLVMLLAVMFSPGAIAQLSPGGWLEVKYTQGSVTLTASPPKVARVGDRLAKPGDSLATGSSSSAILSLDNGIGSINVAENTRLRIRRLSKLRSGGRITMLELDQGQVRLNVRKFNNLDSKLEIHSPAGIAAVRGTEYGISVGRDQRMIVATKSGLVSAVSQGKTVLLKPDFGSRLRPEKPPSQPLPLDRLLKLSIERTEINGQQLAIVGTTHPLNSVNVAGVEVPIDDQGSFEAMIPLSNSTSLFDLEIEVSNALGERRKYPVMGILGPTGDG
jgi:hypothetical protein